MKKFFLLLTLVLMPLTSFAQEQAASASDAKQINMGNWEIGGEASYFQTNDGDDWAIYASPRLEYFFLNRFSAGGRAIYRDGNRISTETSFGPSLTYYFATMETSALYVDQSVLFVNPAGADDNYFAGETGLGWDYFLSPTVALGPSIRGVYYFNGGTGVPEGGLAFRVALSIFL